MELVSLYHSVKQGFILMDDLVSIFAFVNNGSTIEAKSAKAFTNKMFWKPGLNSNWLIDSEQTKSNKHFKGSLKRKSSKKN